jgi:hypothetical protein
MLTSHFYKVWNLGDPIGYFFTLPKLCVILALENLPHHCIKGFDFEF